MNILADVYTPGWVKHPDAEGPIKILSASVNRKLDGAGTIQIDVPVGDERTMRFFTTETRVQIKVEQNGQYREFCRGTIQKLRKNVSTGGKTRSGTGTDALADLKHVVSFAVFDDTLLNVAANQVAARAGWRVELEAGLENVTIDGRYTGASSLKILQTMAKQLGLHLREKLPQPMLGAPVLEMGRFATDINLTLMNINSAVPYQNDNADVAFITSMQILADSEDVTNAAFVFGNGEGTAALTLKYSDDPDVKSRVEDDGKTYYYIEDAASIARYGRREMAVTFKEITQINNSVEGKRRSSNALLQAGREWMARAAVEQTTYRVSVTKCARTVRTGDMIRLWYHGDVRSAYDDVFADETVSGMFYITSASERLSPDGLSLDLEISNVDRPHQDTMSAVVQTMEDVRLIHREPKNTAIWSENTWTDTIMNDGNFAFSDHKWAVFKLEIDEEITEIDRVRIRFKTRPLDNTSNFLSFVEVPPPGISYVAGYWRCNIHTEYPSDLRLFINGIEYTNRLGGPWASGVNQSINVECDITDILFEQTGSIYRDHSIEFRCGQRNAEVGINQSMIQAWGSQGIIELNVRVRGSCLAAQR
jgi:hypothetical protein